MELAQRITSAAAELVNNRKNNQQLDRMAASHRPTSLDETFAIQTEFVKQMNDQVGGWKCLTPVSAEKVIAAPILASTVTRSLDCGIVADKGFARIEPEIAFVLGQDLPAKADGYSESEIDQAVASCHMALELMQTRFTETSAAEFNEKLSDCLMNQGLFIGPELDKEKAYQAATIAIKVSQNNEEKVHDGIHPNGLPYKPLHWLIDYMSKRGVSFTKGQAIITGSYAGIIDVNFDDPCTIEYQGLGHYTISFKAL
ncbi:MAG: fumarylacetoacetate hydrolase family protein [Thalassotalea sp.]